MVSPAVQPRCNRGVVFVWHGILEGSLRNNSTCLRKQLVAVHSSDFAVGFLLFFTHSFACGVVAQLKSHSGHSMITSMSACLFGSQRCLSYSASQILKIQLNLFGRSISPNCRPAKQRQVLKQRQWHRRWWIGIAPDEGEAPEISVVNFERKISAGK